MLLGEALKKAERVRIKWILIVPVNIMSAIVLIGLCTYLYFDISSSMIDSKIRSTFKIPISMGSKAIWDFQITNLDTLVKMLEKDPDIVYAAYYDDQGKEIAASKTMVKSSKVIHKSRDIFSDKNEKIGKLVIGFSFNNTKKFISGLMLRLIIGFVVVQLIITLTLFGVAKGISQMIKSIRQIFGKLTNDIIDGKLSSRGDQFRVGIDFEELVEQINRLIESFTGPIEKVIMVMQTLARKNLAIKLEGEYRGDMAQLSSSVNQAGGNLFDAIGQVNSSVVNVKVGAEQIESSSRHLSEGASKQAEALEEVSCSMKEVGNQTKDNAGSADKAQQISSDARTSASEGNEMMQEMLNAMKEINSSSDDISKIIKVIDEIAFQTNLLALNAAVEAARAGKYGRGFAVVASEVRNLAQKSAKAANETTQLIENSNIKVAHGSSLAQKTAGALEGIVTKSTEVTDLIKNIAMASNEQATAISKVITAIDQISLVTQKNKQVATDSAAASEELSGQSRVLKDLVDEFKLD